MTVRDPEVVHLLRDEPELLALADAVDATQRVGRQRRYVTPVAGAAVAVAALVALALVAPWKSDRANPILERALAAVADGPVIHVKERRMAGERIHLQTGRRAPKAEDVEIWVDGERGRARVTIERNGRVVFDAVATEDDAESWAMYAAASQQAASRYRRLLETGEAKVIREGIVRGRRVYWLGFEDRGRVHEVAIDRQTYTPLLWRLPSGPYEVHYLTIETVERDERFFDVPRPRGTGMHTSGGSSRGKLVGVPSLTLASARTELGRVGLWAGSSVMGLKLARIDSSEVSLIEHDRGERHSEGRQLVIRYGEAINPPGGPDARGVEIRLMRADDPARALIESRGPPPAGYIDLDKGTLSMGRGLCEPKPCDPGPEPFEFTYWEAIRQRNGFWIAIRASSRDLALEAARALRPIPPVR